MGTRTTVAIGLTGITLEHTVLLHEQPGPQPPPGFVDDSGRQRGPSLVGLGLTGAVNTGWWPAAGWNVTALGGLDLVTFLSEKNHVNLGALVGYGASQAGSGVILMIPRLGADFTPWTWGEANAGLGVRLQCLTISFLMCGPALTLTRIRLGE